jgi:MFS transporter, DHA2 family, methylenomycin A resistance protein
MPSQLRTGQTTNGSRAEPGKNAALVSVCLGFFVIQLDVTIVNVALPAIAHELDGSVGALQWIIDAYTLALASVMLTAGSLADRIGARRVFTAGLAGGFITAGQQGWTAPLPWALLAVAAVAAVLLVVAERRQAAPMLPPGLFRSRNLSAATAVGVLFNLCLYGTLICLSLFLQQTRHESALTTGLLILPMSAAVGAGAVASGRLTARFGPRPPMLAGLTLAAAGAVLLASAGTGSLTVLIAGSVLLGLCSLAMPAMTAVAVGSAGPQYAGVASGVLNAARQAGGALGVALLGALLTGSGHNGQGRTLALPLAVAACGYLIATGLAAMIRVER